jgi:hypothetical protein
MNPIFCRAHDARSAVRFGAIKLAGFAAVVIISVILHAMGLRAQATGDPAAEFKRLSQDLSAVRLAGGDEPAARLEKALGYLDSVAIAALNVSATPNLEGANRSLAGLVSRMPPVGENYRLAKLGGAAPVYAMVVNFGQGGPAAVRVYAGDPGHFALVGRIDHFTVKDFFDSDIELVAASGSEPVFVTISGRTDDLSTGVFAAWRFDGRQLMALWNSDLLQQSSYEADESGFHVAYCSRVDDDRPSQCLKMSRDVFQYQGGEWKRTETADLPAPAPAAK